MNAAPYFFDNCASFEEVSLSPVHMPEAIVSSVVASRVNEVTPFSVFAVLLIPWVGTWITGATVETRFAVDRPSKRQW